MGRLGRARRGIDGDRHLALAAAAEYHDAVLEREQRVVLAPAHVDTRRDGRAALPHQDAAGRDPLAAEALHAEALRRGVASVLRARYTFFVCHLDFAPSD